ncbi:MAG TPA: hypothetical protein VK896_13855 [Gaiellaceae bacterium]|nr:hypothetical protein [Gaiellaceae bacterium]
MTPRFELEPYDASRRGDYLRLLGDAWGDRALSGEAFDWWFDGNPEGSLRSVAVRGGDVVGVAGHAFVRFSVGGRERLGQLSVHAVTAPSARGLGVFQALAVRHEEQGVERGSAFVLGFASAPTHPIFLGPLGWVQVDRRRVWARPLPIGRRGTRATAFDHRHESVYRRVSAGFANHVVRSRGYLDWRYARSPRGYRILEAPEGGFAVLGAVRRRGLRISLLMDLVAEHSEAGTLLRAALAEARGTAALLAVPTPCIPRALLARHGFVPTPYRLDLLGKRLAEPLDARPEAWTVSLGDTDFF